MKWCFNFVLIVSSGITLIGIGGKLTVQGVLNNHINSVWNFWLDLAIVFSGVFARSVEKAVAIFFHPKWCKPLALVCTLICTAFPTGRFSVTVSINSFDWWWSWFKVNVYNDVHMKLDMCSFGILNLNVLGAECRENKLALSSSISTDLPLTALTWVR